MMRVEYANIKTSTIARGIAVGDELEYADGKERDEVELIEEQDIDLFIYTDNNDFNYNYIQYFSEKNKERILGISNDYEKRISENIEFINYDKSFKIIKENLIKIFGDRLKKYYIEDFNPNLIDSIYDENNIYHNKFMNYKNPDININWKNAIMCQYYKLYKCYNLLKSYEKDNYKPRLPTYSSKRL